MKYKQFLTAFIHQQACLINLEYQGEQKRNTFFLNQNQKRWNWHLKTQKNKKNKGKKLKEFWKPNPFSFSARVHWKDYKIFCSRLNHTSLLLKQNRFDKQFLLISLRKIFKAVFRVFGVSKICAMKYFLNTPYNTLNMNWSMEIKNGFYLNIIIPIVCGVVI